MSEGRRKITRDYKPTGRIVTQGECEMSILGSVHVLCCIICTEFYNKETLCIKILCET